MLEHARNTVEKYSFDEAWDGPNNLLLADSPPWFYRCPNHTESAEVQYYMVVPGTRVDSLLIVAESYDVKARWSEPLDLDNSWFSSHMNSHVDVGMCIQPSMIIWKDGAMMVVKRGFSRVGAKGNVVYGDLKNFAADTLRRE
jgi:hypothetical protein